MSWTYSGNPAASGVDEVHYRLGDVRPDNPIATDEECAFALAEHRGNTYLAAASLAETKAYELLARPMMVRRGDRITSYGDAAQAFLTLARQLRNNASVATTSLYAGGLSVGEKSSNRRDTDMPPPFARVDLHTSRRGWSPEAEERD